MSKHQAKEQILGYLYQIRFALALLLDNDNEKIQISMETFDDVAFNEDEQVKQVIQLKHHTKNGGNLSDRSTDLWRTLNVWIDLINENKIMLDDTEFFIITTACAPQNTASSYLKKDNNRNVEEAYERLKQVSLETNNKENLKYYNIFNSTGEEKLKELISKIYVIDKASNIDETKKIIKKTIRYTCTSKNEDFVFQSLEGWWYGKSIELLRSKEQIFITQKEVREFIVNLSQKYTDENLPIIEEFDYNVQNFCDTQKNIFLEQIKLIDLKEKRTNIAFRNYCRAYEHRSSWIRQGLLYPSDLDNYDKRLIEEWENEFAIMEEELEKCETTTEDEKIEQGRKLFNDIERKNITIRPKCTEIFIMRGSYHILSSQLKVGWHKDYYERLKNLLNT